MWYLYLDESGDLGFDFVNKKPSVYFTVAILAVNGVYNNRRLIKAVELVLRRKLNPKKKRRRVVEELKGERTNIKIKQYFYKKVKDINFGIYAMTLNKPRVFAELIKKKPRVYNFIARQVLDHFPFDKNDSSRIMLTIDKSKGKIGIHEFNQYIIKQFHGRICPSAPFDIYHKDSRAVKGLQAVDMFAWGIHRRYEKGDYGWYDLFRKDKIKFDDVYLK